MLPDSEIQRVLVVAAHPDDIDFSAAGTVALWTDAGIEVVYCLVTDGDAGGFDESLPRTEMAPMRRKEQTAAAAVLGVSDLRFLGYPDGRLEPTLGLRKDLSRVIRQVRPDRLVCPTPERNYQRIAGSHPDHRAVGAAALDAVYPDARNPFAWPELLTDEGLEAWTVREVWISGAPGSDQFMDITDVFPRKIAALRAHESQTAHLDDLEDFLHSWLARTAERGGLPEGRLAEMFQVLDTG